MLPNRRYQITSMRDDATGSYTSDGKEIGTIICQAGFERSGSDRGDPVGGQEILDNWPADFSSCRLIPSLAEVVSIILHVNLHKRPGSTGICALAYKLQALRLAPIFIESMRELQDPGFDAGNIPPSLESACRSNLHLNLTNSTAAGVPNAPHGPAQVMSPQSLNGICR